MKKMILALSLSLLSPSIFASEQPINTECRTCFSYEQFKTAAEAKAEVNKTRNVYVMNLDSATIKKFVVSKKIEGFKTLPGTGGEPDGEGGTLPSKQIPIYSVTVTNYGVEQSVLNKFYDLSDAKKQVLMSVQTIQADKVPSNVAGSVWDLVGSSSTQNKVAQHYNQYTNLESDLSNYATAAGKVTGVLDIEKILISVNFGDGSSAIFSLYGILNGELVWDFERGTDVDLNKVEPNFDTKNAESYDFSKGGADVFLDFYNAARRAGVSFYSTSGGGSSSGRVTCVSKGVGKYICTYAN
ncbi:hypothetical protein Q4596_01110 [Pseudoalteromonas carrageenovora]|uniref:hypothetical protein n=1 Tax=Pseudoalteromonas carrageenovora TaxID=227 RepID=UPI0026E115EE|nr:hypothetical protein [Pseudoalteromonas carrageenovora]MDO6834197.1 hypothetical protein [Pseudoalteromonas carrageenovora]